MESLLSYDRDTGQFTWLVSRGYVRPGRVAGTKSHGRNRPYWMIKIDGRFYYSHKLAWLLEYDEWPENIDHINGDSLDNRIFNLRKCNMSENKANSKIYKNSTTGHKGVYRRKKDGRYRAHIQRDGKRIWIGTFDTLEAAAEAYWQTAQKLFGSFARMA